VSIFWIKNFTTRETDKKFLSADTTVQRKTAVSIIIGVIIAANSLAQPANEFFFMGSQQAITCHFRFRRGLALQCNETYD
jgi:hypothetical protein